MQDQIRVPVTSKTYLLLPIAIFVLLITIRRIFSSSRKYRKAISIIDRSFKVDNSHNRRISISSCPFWLIHRVKIKRDKSRDVLANLNIANRPWIPNVLSVKPRSSDNKLSNANWDKSLSVSIVDRRNWRDEDEYSSNETIWRRRFKYEIHFGEFIRWRKAIKERFRLIFV